MNYILIASGLSTYQMGKYRASNRLRILGAALVVGGLIYSVEIS